MTLKPTRWQQLKNSITSFKRGWPGVPKFPIFQPPPLWIVWPDLAQLFQERHACWIYLLRYCSIALQSPHLVFLVTWKSKIKCLVMQFMHRTHNTQQEKLLINKCMTNNQQNLQSMLLRVLEETERIHQLFMAHYLELNSLSCSCCWTSCSISLDASFTCGTDVKNGVRVWNWTNLAYIGIQSACSILSMLLLHVATTKRKRQHRRLYMPMVYLTIVWRIEKHSDLQSWLLYRRTAKEDT